MKQLFIVGMMAAVCLSFSACEKAEDVPSSDFVVATENNEIPENAAIKENAVDTQANETTQSGVDLEFTTYDLDGNAICNEDFSDAKLIMVNFWEPWCGPCVREMPELEKLYLNYQEQGLMIVGVFYSEDCMEDAKNIVNEVGVTYPIIVGNEELATFTTEYVPTTVFFDGEGCMVSSEPVIGAMDYESWEQVVLQFLGEN